MATTDPDCRYGESPILDTLIWFSGWSPRGLHRGVLLLFLMVAGGFAFGESDVRAQPLDRQLARVDSLLNGGEFVEALQLIQTLRQGHPIDGNVLWRSAYTRVQIGERAESPAVRESFYRSAFEEASLATVEAPTNADGHFALAMAAGRWAPLQSSNQEKIRLSRLVKESADRAIELDPRHDGAYHARARWHYEISQLGFFTRSYVRLVYGGLPDASLEKAVQDFRRALEIENRIAHHLYLGQALAGDGQVDAAVKHWKTVLAMPPDHPSDPRYKEEAKAFLSRYRR